MVGAGTAPTENQPHVCTSTGTLERQRLCTGSGQGRECSDCHASRHHLSSQWAASKNLTPWSYSPAIKPLL